MATIITGTYISYESRANTFEGATYGGRETIVRSLDITIVFKSASEIPNKGEEYIFQLKRGRDVRVVEGIVRSVNWPTVVVRSKP